MQPLLDNGLVEALCACYRRSSSAVMKNDDDLHALRLATFYALALNSLIRNTSSKPLGILDACAAVLARRYSAGLRGYQMLNAAPF